MARMRIAAAALCTRGTGAAPEVLLARRAPELRFFGGYDAFPGGVLDPEDGVADDEEALAAATLRAAVREVFEETGLLPAGFEDLLADGVLPRPGIIETISRARHAGLRLGFVTTTTPRTLDMIRDALASHIDFAEFAVTTSKADVAMEKPDGEAYETALHRLGLLPSEAIAFEDTVASQSSAHAAGLRCHLYAGEYAHVGVAPMQTRDPAAALAADLDAAMMIESDKLMTRTAD